MILGYLAIDFGGTQTRAAWFNNDFTLIHRYKTLSQVEEPQATVIQRIIDTARQVVPADSDIEGIGMAAPGPLNIKNGVILHARTLPGWKDVPIAQLVSAGFGGIPVAVNNDANLGALAEHQLGAGQGANPMIYLTISTGIGGGVVIDGKVFTGGYGFASEPGHQLFQLPDGEIKRLEEIASGTALGLTGVDRAPNHPESSLHNLEKITGKSVGEAAQTGDALALEIIGEAAHYLGLGLVNVLHLFNPQAIVIGGSVTLLGDLLFDPVKRLIQERVMDPVFWRDDMIRVATMGDDVCLYGAALYAAQEKGE